VIRPQPHPGGNLLARIRTDTIWCLLACRIDRGRVLAINHYEGMFILDSGRFGANPDAAAAEVTGIIEKVGGTVSTHRPWQDSKLAYPINGHRKGLYYLAFFTAESRAVNEINGIVKLNDNVLRHLVLSHDKGLYDQMVEMVGGEAFRTVDPVDPDAPSAKPAKADAPSEKPAEAATTDGEAEVETAAAE
jgi:small subunit ribosomal protein S6